MRSLENTCKQSSHGLIPCWKEDEFKMRLEMQLWSDLFEYSLSRNETVKLIEIKKERIRRKERRKMMQIKKSAFHDCMY